MMVMPPIYLHGDNLWKLVLGFLALTFFFASAWRM
jgi:hypothetical protein